MDGRYLAWRREAVDDGWEADGEESRIETTVTIEHPKTIITRNQSPDIPFEASINPYRGCEHGCIYCLSGDTQILMADGTPRELARLQIGDPVYGTARHGWHRRYVKSRVLAHWSAVKPAYRITLADGTSLVAGPDHRFLTERGWKFITGTEQGHARRPHLTTRNKLMGTGAFADAPLKNLTYKHGYLCGMIRGDGLLASYHYERAARVHDDQHHFRLALVDTDALQRTRDYLRDCQIDTHAFIFQKAIAGHREMHGIRNYSRPDVERIRTLIEWPATACRDWSAGFLAGIFDAEGSFSQGVLRISNTDNEIIGLIGRSLRAFGFRFLLEHTKCDHSKPVIVVRVLGGLSEHLRFFHTVDTAITRKRDITGQAVNSEAQLEVIGIEPLGKAQRLFDITTGTEDFIANGVISHNCYARPTHAYHDLSPGIDFETKLFAKPDAAAMLRRELSQPGYRCTPIALGTNTDPYQPIEREWRITRQIIEVLHETDHPLTIVTKSSRVERDLDLLAPMAEKNLVQVFFSITTLNNALARRMEPRAGVPARRLEALRRLAAAGIPIGVLFAPVIPFLNDDELESVLEQAAQAGACWAGYVILRLPHEIKDLFKDWLEQHEPLKAARVMNTIRDLRGGREYDAQFFSRQRGTGVYADLIARRFAQACERLSLNHNRVELRIDLFRPPREATPQLDMF